MLRVYALLLAQVAAAVLLLASCSQNISGPVQVRLIKSRPGRCQYVIEPTTLTTLQSLNEMRGTIGRVVYNPDNLDSNPVELDTGSGFKSVDVSFAESGGVYTPNDMNTLYAASLYHAVEEGYLLFQNSGVDLRAIVPNMQDTMIVYDTRRGGGDGLSSRSEVTDNAEYYAVIPDGITVLRNYFFSYPNEAITQVPMGLNTGIFVHEFTHMAFQHLLRSAGTVAGYTADSSTRPTANTLSALEEGMGDYFGFVATGDPGFFLCSDPSENRDLAAPKWFSPEVVMELASASDDNFDPHTGGAVWAAIQYEIGERIGRDKNAKSLAQLMSGLLTCVDATGGGRSLSLDFGTVAKCHRSILSQLGYDANTAAAIYQKYMGSYGGP